MYLVQTSRLIIPVRLCTLAYIWMPNIGVVNSLFTLNHVYDLSSSRLIIPVRLCTLAYIWMPNIGVVNSLFTLNHVYDLSSENVYIGLWMPNIGVIDDSWVSFWFTEWILVQNDSFSRILPDCIVCHCVICDIAMLFWKMYDIKCCLYNSNFS